MLVSIRFFQLWSANYWRQTPRAACSAGIWGLYLASRGPGGWWQAASKSSSFLVCQAERSSLRMVHSWSAAGSIRSSPLFVRDLGQKAVRWSVASWHLAVRCACSLECWALGGCWQVLSSLLWSFPRCPVARCCRLGSHAFFEASSAGWQSCWWASVAGQPAICLPSSCNRVDAPYQLSLSFLLKIQCLRCDLSDWVWSRFSCQKSMMDFGSWQA